MKQKRFETFLWLILSLAMILTLKEAWKLYSPVPMTDPIGYIELAQNSRFFFDTTPREPLHIFLVKLSLPFFQQPETALRILTILFTFLSFGILGFWVRRTVGFWPAVLTSLGFISSSLIAYYSVQGFNMVSYIAFLLLFLTVWDYSPHLVSPLGSTTSSATLRVPASVATPLQPSPPAPLPKGRGEVGNSGSNESTLPSFSLQGEGPRMRESVGDEGVKRMWLLGVIAGLTALCRLEGFLVCSLCLMSDGLIQFRRDGGKMFRRSCGAVLIAFLMVSPYLLHQKITHGSFVYSHHGHAAFWANKESITQPAVLQFFKGMWLAVIWYTPRLLQGTFWQWLFIPFGLLFLVRHRRWKPAFLWAASILPVAYILPIDAVGPHSGVELRFLLPTLPLLCALSGMGSAWLLEVSGKPSS
jgi:hypothetical protein